MDEKTAREMLKELKAIRRLLEGTASKNDEAENLMTSVMDPLQNVKPNQFQRRPAAGGRP